MLFLGKGFVTLGHEAPDRAIRFEKAALVLGVEMLSLLLLVPVVSIVTIVAIVIFIVVELCKVVVSFLRTKVFMRGRALLLKEVRMAKELRSDRLPLPAVALGLVLKREHQFLGFPIGLLGA